jgi:type I restriction enzyme, S subunit
MIADLKPYQEYKESGQMWIGAVPKHWSVLPNRAIFVELNERNHPNEEMLSVTITKGVIHQKALLAGSSKKDSSNQDKSAYKLVCPRDIAYNKMRAWQGAIGVSDFRGIISPAYIVMRLRESHNARYFHYLYRTPHFAKEAERWSYGITSDMWSLRPEHFKMIYTPLPFLDEQVAIVRFLDYANRRLERVIRAKRKVIALLNEQKQAIIHHAVTQGRNSEWRSMPVRAVLRPVKRLGFPDKTILSLFRDFGVVPKDSRENKNVDVRDLALCQLVQPGNVVMNKMKAWQGSIAVSQLEGIVSPDYMVLQFVTDQVVPRFFHYLLRSPEMVASYRRNAYGVRPGQWRLMYPDFCRLTLFVPPVHEQAAVAQFIDTTVANIDVTAEGVRREIHLLREYRTRLLADVVTGKLDVREAARQLPIEADEPKARIEADPLNEGEESIDGDVEMIAGDAEESRE